MSVSPKPLPALSAVTATSTTTASTIIPSPNGSCDASNFELANLLSKAYADIDVLRQQLHSAIRRAERAERLSTASTSATATHAALKELEARLDQAEQARDEANARRARIQEYWSEFDRWWCNADVRIQENRLAFGKVITEGGGHLNLIRLPLITELNPLPSTHQNHVFAMPPPTAGGRASTHGKQKKLSFRLKEPLFEFTRTLFFFFGRLQQ
jgi:hypothetical protein